MRSALLAVAAAALLGACDPGPELPRLDADAVILAFGDSLTYGTGAGDGESYPEVMEEITGRTVVGAGVPGEISARGLRRLPGVLDAEEPDLLVLVHGGNDFLRKRPRRETEANLRAMVREARGRGIPVVLVGVPEFGLVLDSAELYETVAEESGVPLEDEILPGLLGDNRYKSDHVHPNAAGYRRMAEALAALLREHGAL